MFLAYSLWDARTEIDGAEARGADAGVIRQLRDTLAQCEADGDAATADAIARYAARLGPAGPYTRDTAADVAVGAGLEVARAAQWTTSAVALLVVAAVVVVASTWRR